MLKVSLSRARYVISALDARSAQWLRDIAAKKFGSGLSAPAGANGPACIVDPRFIDEFLSSARDANLQIVGEWASPQTAARQ